MFGALKARSGGSRVCRYPGGVGAVISCFVLESYFEVWHVRRGDRRLQAQGRESEAAETADERFLKFGSETGLRSL